MDTAETSQTKIEKPHAHFDYPRQVIAEQEKVEALETLEQDARLLATATDEGMTGGEQSNLHDVLNAKKALDNPTAAPTSTTASNPPPGSEAEVAKEVEVEKLDP